MITTILLPVYLLALVLCTTSQDPDLLSQCCRQGDKWGPSHGPQDCRNLVPTRGSVAPPDEALCQDIMHICCLKRYRADMCLRGKASARTGRAQCTGPGNTEAFKDCCEGCQVGLSLSAKGHDCESLDVDLGCPWGEAARECCFQRQSSADNPADPNNPLGPAQNRCEASPRPCSQQCYDPGAHAGPVRCTCRAGYTLARDRKNCIDIDECVDGRHTCDHDRETCLNSPGGFHCVENEFPAQKPVDSVPPRPPLPPHPSTGNLVPDSRCPLGFVFNGTFKVCNDLDECAGPHHSCDPATQTCTNTVGSFVCQPLTSENEVDTPQPQCPPGFKHQIGQGCIDIDECLETLDNCDLSSEYCLNVYGSFQCQPKTSKTCPAGYKYHQSGICTDVDECAEELHACQEGEEVCKNTAGGYVCNEACPDGGTFNKETGKCQGAPQPSVPDHNPFPPPSSNCPAGYKKKSSREDFCVDVDECQEDVHSCDLDRERCVNKVGSYDCEPHHVQEPEDPSQRNTPSCPTGSKFDPQARICRDVDECAEGLNDCDPSRERCLNTQGSYRCQMDPARTARCGGGFIFDHVTGGCRDVDECQVSPCPTGTRCLNLHGSFRCEVLGPNPGRNDTGSDFCRRGYEWNPNSRSCVDVDECRDAVTVCPGSQCENTVGSYKCGCAPGHTLDPVTRTCADLNECQLGLHNCLPTQRCDNTVGSFVCVRITSCGTGYTVNAQTGICEDDDECRIRQSACGPEFLCRNTLGSFRCDRRSCGPGERHLPDGSCQPRECSPGTKLSPLGNCADVDECATGAARCRSNQRCINSFGSYTCQSLLVCGGGYEPDPQGTQCSDVDECADNTHECGSGQVCRNRPGGYSCECPTGFTLNAQRECEDVDECSRFAGQVCSISSQCQNTVGSYNCDCKPGFSKLPGSQSCTDLDECRDNPNLCQHNCINTWGSYQCTCKAGFTLGAENRSCVDIDECSLYRGKGNLCIGFCVNEPGSFSCSCPDGYRLGGDLRTCQDINECQELGVCAGEDQVCLNTRGGYKCTNITCPPNYVRDREHRNQATGVCRKRCHPADQECINNSTQSVSFQSVALPSVPELPRPLTLSTMRLTSSQSPTGRPPGQNFIIQDGNSVGYFDIVTGDGVGSVRLIRPIIGPQDLLLKVLMEAQLRRKLSRHLVFLHINVSPYDF